jgi:hypothetical protein
MRMQRQPQIQIHRALFCALLPALFFIVFGHYFLCGELLLCALDQQRLAEDDILFYHYEDTNSFAQTNTYVIDPFFLLRLSLLVAGKQEQSVFAVLVLSGIPPCPCPARQK